MLFYLLPVSSILFSIKLEHVSIFAAEGEPLTIGLTLFTECVGIGLF